jgi:plastocyanin
VRRRLGVLFLGALVAGAVPLVGVASAHDYGPRAVTATITGKNLFVVNRLGGADYKFPDVIFIGPGGTITFQNKSDDFHTITFVNKADEPTTADQANNCGVCNEVNNLYGLGGSGPPATLQIVNGDPAGTGVGPDPAVPGGIGPFGLSAREVQFAHPATPAFGGDSSTIAPASASVGLTARTIKAPTTPGVYRYMCTLHPWMQGKIIVGP